MYLYNQTILGRKKIMKRGLAVVTFILGVVTAVLGVATSVLSLLNVNMDKKYLD